MFPDNKMLWLIKRALLGSVTKTAIVETLKRQPSILLPQSWQLKVNYLGNKKWECNQSILRHLDHGQQLESTHGEESLNQCWFVIILLMLISSCDSRWHVLLVIILLSLKSQNTSSKGCPPFVFSTLKEFCSKTYVLKAKPLVGLKGGSGKFVF